MEALGRGEGLADGHAAHVILGDVVEQRSEHEVGHRLRDRHGVQHALVVVHVGQGRPTLEGAEGRAHRGTGVLRTGGAVSGVPGRVLLDGAVPEVTEGALVVGRHPQIEGARVEVVAQAAGVGARRAATDPVRVERVTVGVEPLDTVGFVAPERVQEGLDGCHLVGLTRLHLGAGPVDRVDLGLGADGGEEVVPGAPVVLEEVVAVHIVDEFGVPGLCLLAREVAADDGAATALDQGHRLGWHGAGGDVGVVDLGPRAAPGGELGLDLLDPLGDQGLDLGEDLLDGATARRDARLECGLDLTGRGSEVVRGGLPVGEGREFGGHRRHRRASRGRVW